MSSLTSKAFWAASTERAVRTGAQSAVAVLIADATDLFTTDWLGLLSVVVMAVLLSYLTSIAGGSGRGKGPALVGPEATDHEPKYAAKPMPSGDGG